MRHQAKALRTIARVRFLRVCFLCVLVLILLAIGSDSAKSQDSPAALSGFSSSEIFDITDGRPLKMQDPALSRLLFRVMQTSRTSLRKYGQTDAGVGVKEIRSSPRDYRCHVISIAGLATDCLTIQNSLAEEGEPNQRIVLVRVETESGEECVVVLPASRADFANRWLASERIHEPVKFQGFFLAVYDFHADAEADAALQVLNLKQAECPILVANQLEWYPDGNSQVATTMSEQLLAKHRVDIGEKIGRMNGKMTKQDSLPFYQLLAAADSIEAVGFPTAEQVKFTDCLQRPRQCFRKPVQVRGLVRQVTEVKVSDPQINAEFGLKRYYQLQMFVPLKNQQIVVQAPRSDANGSADENDGKIRHENRFPVTVCVAKLPAPIEEVEGKLAAVEGFFFKLWNYESELSRSKSASLNQISPLIVGQQPKLIADSSQDLNWWIGLAALLGITGIAMLAWFYRPTEQRSAIRSDLPDSIEMPGDDQVS